MLGTNRVVGAMCRSVAINTQWVQKRIRNAGYSDTSLCQLCGLEDGTLVHRHNHVNGCPHMAAHRDGTLSEKAKTFPLGDSQALRQTKLHIVAQSIALVHTTAKNCT